jgi:hypothetical protein
MASVMSTSNTNGSTTLPTQSLWADKYRGVGIDRRGPLEDFDRH